MRPSGKASSSSKLAVTAPGVEQKATWLQIRQQRPDYVFLWGWGVMNSTAIKEAIAVSYPQLQMYGVWWSARNRTWSQPKPTWRRRARAASHSALSSERDLPVHKDIAKYAYDSGEGTARKSKEEVGSVLYNRGTSLPRC